MARRTTNRRVEQAADLREGLRVLGRIRLSRFQGKEDVTTSPERQRLAIERWAEANGHVIIGWAEDLDLGRSVDPLEAPELGKWFKEPERTDAWDIIAGYRLDRVATGSIYLSKVMAWCLEHGKSIVSTSETFDLNSSPGRMVAFILAEVAAGELEAIRERNTNAFDYTYSKGMYTGRMTPYGYKADGNEYAVDHDAKAVILEIVERVISQESIRKIVIDLNERGVPSPSDQQRLNVGKASRSARWSHQSINRILTSETLLGYAMRRDAILGKDGRPIRDAKGKKQFGESYVVRDETGAPVVRAEPILSRTRFDELQEALGKRVKSAPQRRKTETDMLLRVFYCPCGEPRYTVSNGSRTYYRCASSQKGKPCGQKAIRKELAETIFEEGMLDSFGNLPMQKRVYVPATNNADELASIEAEIENIADMITAPAFRGKTRDKLAGRLEVLDKRRSELEAQPVRQAGYRLEPTGETFAEHWGGLDSDRRNAFLRNAGVRFEMKSDIEFHFDFTHLELLLGLIDPSIDPQEHLDAEKAKAAAYRAELEAQYSWGS
ncbi:recombinase family protein [Saccharopolyspora antimicrobica]|uniref:recombinase family protein n=1 Tax=Saccharopolyspora antimicrobica TaxID=455193 RepID=UPI000B81C256|nr:recombinase family protein [Saccharopolyspora antimicrobica]